MAGHFTHHFEDRLLSTEADAVIGQAHQAIGTLEVFQALPVGNQELVLAMAGFAIDRASSMATDERWRDNFWGLYVIGSRARDEAGPDPDNRDLDLLSVGTFFRDQDFSQRGTLDGFELTVPDVLPDEYNVGAVDRKYLIRARPKVTDALPVDLNVVDLTFVLDSDLDEFKDTMDVSGDGSALPRIPLFELTVAYKHVAPVELHY